MVSKASLAPVAAELWCVEHDLFMPPLRFHFPCRMTVVRLPDGTLLLHSPVPIEDDVAEQLTAVGPVRHLVAPSCYHHLYLADAARRYPEARLYGAPGLQEKRPQLAIDEILAENAPPAWSGVIEQVLVGGMPAINEVVFFHRPTRSLILTDLVFNIHHSKNIQTPLLLRLVGVWGRLAQSRIYRSMVRDPEAAAASARRILAWDVERIVPAHGDILTEGAGDALRDALAKMAKMA